MTIVEGHPVFKYLNRETEQLTLISQLPVMQVVSPGVIWPHSDAPVVSNFTVKKIKMSMLGDGRHNLQPLSQRALFQFIFIDSTL